MTIRAAIAILTLAIIIAVTIPTIVTAQPVTPASSSPCNQWHRTAIQAGFSERHWPTVARIMWRESRCQPRARNRSGATGLMQIMPMWKPVCRTDLTTGYGNLRCARLILRVQGWSAWR